MSHHQQELDPDMTTPTSSTHTPTVSSNVPASSEMILASSETMLASSEMMPVSLKTVPASSNTISASYNTVPTSSYIFLPPNITGSVAKNTTGLTSKVTKKPTTKTSVPRSSLTSNVTNSAPVQRAAFSCTKCKLDHQSCSKHIPSCIRCTRRGTECDYTWIPPPKRRRLHTTLLDAAAAPEQGHTSSYGVAATAAALLGASAQASNDTISSAHPSYNFGYYPTPSQHPAPSPYPARFLYPVPSNNASPSQNDEDNYQDEDDEDDNRRVLYKSPYVNNDPIDPALLDPRLFLPAPPGTYGYNFGAGPMPTDPRPMQTVRDPSPTSPFYSLSASSDGPTPPRRAPPTPVRTGPLLDEELRVFQNSTAFCCRCSRLMETTWASAFCRKCAHMRCRTCAFATDDPLDGVMGPNGRLLGEI